MQATIVEFRKEQGMGRANVDGIGELSFDASVVGVAWNRLVPGRQVQVERLLRGAMKAEGVQRAILTSGGDLH